MSLTFFRINRLYKMNEKVVPVLSGDKKPFIPRKFNTRKSCDVPLAKESVSENFRSNGEFDSRKGSNQQFWKSSLNDADCGWNTNSYSKVSQSGNNYNGNYQKRNFSTGAPRNSVTKDLSEDWFKLYDRSNDYEGQVFGKDAKSGINFDNYESIPVSIEGKKCELTPEIDIEKLEIAEIFNENMKISGYKKLTPIQKYAFPCLLDKHDLVACAQTGSGKTAAFVVPLLQHIYSEGAYSPKSNYSGKATVCMPKALILAPTRELATQIYEQAVKFSYRTKIRPAVVYGGVSVKYQYNSLINSGHLLVGTPGRVSDLFNRGLLSFKNCRYLVLDEADRMLDMGFKPQIDSILGETDFPNKEERLNCMFSATMAEQVMDLVYRYLNNYVLIKVGKIGATTDNIKQKFVEMFPCDRFENLLKEMSNEDRILVFTETKACADDLEGQLYDNGYKVVCIHGDRDQQDRDMALSLFKRGEANIMVATGVASRGIDVPNVKKVIIYEMPSSVDEFVHRIGRTGRAGNVGEAVTFLTMKDSGIIPDLVTMLKTSKQEIPDVLLKMQSLKSNKYMPKGRNSATSTGGRPFQQSRYNNNNNNRGYGGNQRGNKYNHKSTSGDFDEW